MRGGQSAASFLGGCADRARLRGTHHRRARSPRWWRATNRTAARTPSVRRGRRRGYPRAMGPARATRSMNSSMPGIDFAATVASGPAATALTRIRSSPRYRARYRVTDWRADLETPIQSYAGHAVELSKSSVTSDPPPAARISGRRPTARVLYENADVRNAVAAESAGVSRKLPPSASSGAYAIACRAPSTAPHRSVRSATSASMWSGSLMSSSSTGGGSGSRFAERSVSRIARPKPVSTISAPCS